MHQFVPEMCTYVHISVTKWYIVRYGIIALRDFLQQAIGDKATLILVKAQYRIGDKILSQPMLITCQLGPIDSLQLNQHDNVR